MSQEHSAPFSSNLSHRLIIIFLILTLAVYAAGLTVTLKLRSNAVQDSQAAYLAQAEMFSDQLNNELTRISTQMKYTLTRSVTLWLSLAPNNTSFPQLYEFVLRMTDQIYSLQNTSSLIESTSVYFSELDKCIHSSGTYNTPTDTERLLIDSYYEMPAHSAVLAVDGQLYLVSDAFTFNSKAATSLVWAQLSNKLLSQLCGQYTEDGQPAVLYCIGDSGSYLAIGGNSDFSPAAILADIQTAAAEGKSGMVSATVDGTPCLRALQPVGAWNLWVARYASSRAPREVTEPFTVWIIVQTAITLLAAGSFVFLVWGGSLPAPSAASCSSCKSWNIPAFRWRMPTAARIWTFCTVPSFSWGRNCKTPWSRHITAKSWHTNLKSNICRHKSIPIFCTTASITYTAWQKWRTPRAWRK